MTKSYVDSPKDLQEHKKNNVSGQSIQPVDASCTFDL